MANIQRKPLAVYQRAVTIGTGVVCWYNELRPLSCWFS